jgi:ferric-dicitrate binding protein FerR (iron transport regulator)
MDKQRITYLINGFLEGKQTPAEKAELNDFLEEPSNREAFVAIVSQLTAAEEEIPAVFDESLLPMLSQVLEADKPKKKTVIPFRIPYWRVAAAVLIGIGTAGYLYWHQQASRIPEDAVQGIVAAPILSGTNKAMLTLDDGTVIPLDSTGSQTIQQGNTTAYRHNGALQYQGGRTSAVVRYNTLTTPRGGQYEVILPDGTKVWLNADSRLRYPVSFAGNERVVELEGQAYFETVRDAHQPFLVKVGNMAVQVLGTSFDIMAYKDEKSIHTTLISGAIKVAANKENRLLRPGQQAVIAEGGIDVNTVNTDDVIAWKNGYFSFRDADISAVMRQLSRWYDVTVSYPAGIPKGTFSGEIGRSLSLLQALKILEQTNVNFKVGQDRHIVILP